MYTYESRSTKLIRNDKKNYNLYTFAKENFQVLSRSDELIWVKLFNKTRSYYDYYSIFVEFSHRFLIVSVKLFVCLIVTYLALSNSHLWALDMRKPIRYPKVDTIERAHCYKIENSPNVKKLSFSIRYADSQNYNLWTHTTYTRSLVPNVGGIANRHWKK